MRKAILALSLLAMTALAAFADISVTITNKTGVTISEVYIAPSSAEYWGNSLIRSNQLILNNRYRRITLRGFDDEEFFDIKIVDRSQNVYTLWGMALKSEPAVTVTEEHREAAPEQPETTADLSAPAATATPAVTASPTGPEVAYPVEPATSKPTETPESDPTEDTGGFVTGYKAGFGDGFQSGFEAGYQKALEQLRKEAEEREKAELEAQRREKQDGNPE